MSLEEEVAEFQRKQEIAEFQRLNTPTRARRPKLRKSKFAGVKTTYLSVRLTDEQLDEIDRIAGDAKHILGGKPCPRMVVLRELIKVGLAQVAPFVEDAKRRREL